MTVVIIVFKKPFYLWVRFKFIDIPEYKELMLAQAIVQLKFQKENQKVNAENEVQFYEWKCWCFVRNINFKTQK